MTNYDIAREYLPTGIYPIDLTDKRRVYEISVPTCSYRMGVDRIGYGVLLLDSGRISYTTSTIQSTLLFRDQNGPSGNSVHAQSVFWIVPLRSLWDLDRSLLDRHVVVLETNTHALVAIRSIISRALPRRRMSLFLGTVFHFHTM